MSAPAARVLLVSGHMVDAPNRPQPRFPPGEVPRVAADVGAALNAWEVGEGTTIVCGGARGADILAAEYGLRKGAHVIVCLALPPDQFARRSVDIPNSDWHQRFRDLLAHAEVRQLADEGTRARAEDVFARTNAWMLDVALGIDPQPHVLLIWNGKEGDGPGGTRDMIRRLEIPGPSERVRVVDPTPRAYQQRQSLERPKRLLSLDGGGIRGVVSLEILRAIEEQLRERTGDSAVVLADYFDYIGGTSTGAILAVALSLGYQVAELQNRYGALGKEVFSKRFMPARVRSVYRDGPLREQLTEFYGANRTLGDTELRTLLLLIMHNSVTDSPWLLTNCTDAKYNRADRYLMPVPDRNLDISLINLVRASAAAPFYFLPEEVMVGSRKFVFQDGGVTPFNNPAVALFLVATLPEYGLNWPVGDDQLLLVSVGTGSSAAVHPRRTRRRSGLWSTRSLPAIFMNGASVGQDMQARSVGRCVHGAAIDREFGSRLGSTGIGGRSLFQYVRYDADLSDEALECITNRRKRARLRKLDAFDEIGLLADIGQRASKSVDIGTHFAGFLR